MKKVISILLVAMLIIGMFPATAITASAADGTWTLVSDASTLAAGDQLVIACTSKGFVAGAISSSVMGNVAATFSGKTISALPTGAVVLTLGGSAGSWTLSNAEGKTLGATAAKKVAWGSGTAKWSITIAASGDATIQNGTSSYGRFLYNVNSPRFTTYTSNTSSSMLLPQLYRLETSGTTPDPEPECTHDGTTIEQNAKAADCINPGKEADIFCTACKETISTGKEIPALGHNYVDGICERCGEAEPVVTVVGRYYIAAIRKEGNYFYMTSNVNDRSRYVAVDSGLTVLPESIDEAEAATNQVFALIDNGDSTYSLRAEGVEGDNYLGWNSDNTGTLVAEDKALDLTVTITDGIYQISFQGDAERYLSLNATTGNDYFVWYKTGQKKELNLIPVVEAEAEPVAEANGETYPSVEAAYEADPEAVIKLLAEVENVTVDGALYLDLNGNNATNVTATKIYAYDSSASAAAAGTGSITTSSEVVMDNTVNNIRYIALAEGEEESKTYTFHVLDMYLSAVSLRTNACGIYYKAKYECDEDLAAKVSSYGVVFSVNDMPGADFMTEEGNINLYTAYSDKANLLNGKEVTSGSIFGIMKEGKGDNAARGTREIYANAYIIIDGVNDGNPLMAETGVDYSLYEVMKAINDNWSKYVANKQDEIIKNFYNTWANEGMSAWEEELLNIVGTAE